MQSACDEALKYQGSASVYDDPPGDRVAWSSQQKSHIDNEDVLFDVKVGVKDD